MGLEFNALFRRLQQAWRDDIAAALARIGVVGSRIDGSHVAGTVTATNIAVHDIVSKHTASGLTSGHVLTASSPTAFGFAAPAAPAAHAASHQNGGGDEISVVGLSGLLADGQTPVDHDHSGDAGDGGTFDAANLGSGAATDGHVLTADGAGGAAFESPPAAAAHDHTTGDGSGVLTNDEHDGYMEITEIAAPGNPAAGKQRVYIDSTSHKAVRKDSTGAMTDLEGAGGGSGDVTYAQLLAMQLVNEIKGWPPLVNTGDLDALNLWWDKVGTPSTAPSVVAVSGEGITETYELALKVVGDAASEGLSQRYTYADEPRIKSGRVVSALLAIWSVSAVEVTAKLLNSDASETAAAAVTAAAWTIVEIPAHTLAGTYCDLQVTAGAAGTFYVVPLGLCIGSRGLALPPRLKRYVDQSSVSVVSGVDPGGAGYVDVDLTAATSPLAMAALMHFQYWNGSTADKKLYARRNGSSDDSNQCVMADVNVQGKYAQGIREVALDDGQIFEYRTNGAAANAEAVYADVVGWWEWA